MLAYNVRIAWKSLRRNPWLTTIIVGGIALGICASTTFTTVRHMYVRDPLPGKSQKLFYVRLDDWDLDRPFMTDGKTNRHAVPPQITYRDAIELWRSKIPVRQTMGFRSWAIVYPDRKISRPYYDPVRFITADFFSMFELPFQFGHPWDRRADEKGEQVAVIDDSTNQKLFAGTNSIGKTLRIKDRNFTVVGVLAPFHPFYVYYDWVSAQKEPDHIFLPFHLAIDMEQRNSFNSSSPAWSIGPVANTGKGSVYLERLYSERDWIQYWVEFRSPADLSAYQRFVDEYVLGQKKLGRFPRPLNNVIMSMRDVWIDRGLIQPQIHAMAAISILFLVICALNLTGLVLAKFLARAPEISVRRALGASRSAIFLQHVVECELAGIGGGVIGIALSAGVLRYIGKLVAAQGHVLRFDLEMIAVAIFLSLGAGLMAGLYPAWRVCRVQPAVQLKL